MSGNSSSWPLNLYDPTQNRLEKPRGQGISMVIDKGLGLEAFLDLLHIANPFIDYIKLGFGTSVLYPEKILRKKIKLAHEFNVKIFPGGTLLEVAINQHLENKYFEKISELGFKTIEISDGTIEISPADRKNLITTAKSLGLEVITEYGKKIDGSTIDFDELNAALCADVEDGASFVIVEGRESGSGVGIYDKNGNFDANDLIEYISKVPLNQKLIWEAPQKKQQAQFIQSFGPNVNLGNISPDEVIALEALRRGLRSDTFVFKRSEEYRYEG